MSLRSRRILLGITAALLVVLIGLLVAEACGGEDDYVPIQERLASTRSADPTNPLCQTSEARAYIRAVETRLEYISDASFEIADLLTRASEVPQLVISDNWQDDFNDQLHTFARYSEELLQMNNPQALLAVQRHLDDMANDLLSAVEYYELALEDLDSVAFEVGATYLNEATTSLRLAQGAKGVICRN